MAEPNWEEKGEPKSEQIVWKDKTGKVVGQGNDYRPSEGLLGLGRTEAKRYSRVLFANGETWDIAEDETVSDEMVSFDQGMASNFRALANQGGNAPTVRRFPDDTERQYNPETKQWDVIGQPSASSQRPTGISGATGNKAQFPVAMPDGSVQWIADPNYDPEMSAIEKAKAKNDLIRDMFQDLLDQRKFTRQQLEAAYAENYKQLDAQIRIDMQALARESQTQDYAQKMGQAGANTAMQALPYMVPKGTTANLNKAIASMGSGSSAPVQYDPIEPQPFPFGDPTNLANNIALRAAAQWSPMAREQLGMPAPTGFKVPPLMLQEPVQGPSMAQAQGQAAEMIAAQPNAGVGFRAPTLEEIQRAGPNSALYGAPW